MAPADTGNGTSPICPGTLRGWAGRRAIVSEMSTRWNLLPRFARDRLLVCFQALRGRPARHGSGPSVLVAACWESSTSARLAQRERMVASEAEASRRCASGCLPGALGVWPISFPRQNNSATSPQLISNVRVFFGVSCTVPDGRVFAGPCHKLAKFVRAQVARYKANIPMKPRVAHPSR